MAAHRPRTLAAAGVGLLLRLFLFAAFPRLPALLANRVEISTPVTSYKRLHEGLYLYTHSLSPYDGGVFHQAPLLLAFFSALPSALTNVVYILADVQSALALASIAASGVPAQTARFTSGRRGTSWPPWAVAAAFLLNPFGVATCLGRSTIVFTSTAVLTAVAKAVAGEAVPAMLALAMAAYLSLYPVLLLPPLILLAYDSRRSLAAAVSGPQGSRPQEDGVQQDEKKQEQEQEKGREPGPGLPAFAAAHTGVFAGAAAALLALSWVLTGGSWEFLRSTYGVHLLLPDLTPNVGLWWYFFIEMFDSFREFFLCVFQLHLLVYVGGLCVRLRKQPLFAITTLLGICAIFKSYPSIGDTALYLSVLSLYRHIFPLMRYTFFATSTLLYATLLGPAFYYLWIYAGSGNANFFYAITLVWCLALTVLVADALHAVLRDEWEVERPEMRGRDAVQI